MPGNLNRESTSQKKETFKSQLSYAVSFTMLICVIISCGMDAKTDEKIDAKTVRNKNGSNDTTSYNNHLEDRFQFKHQFGKYLFDIKHLKYRDSLYIDVTKVDDSSITLRERLPSIAKVENVYIRDLDNDGLLELYVITIDGQASYATINMYELEGDSLEYGDLSKLYAPYKFSFTDKQLIHEHWLESADGCCDYLGMEFTYFELINNQFKLMKKSDFRHRAGTVVNRSEELKDL